MEQASQEQIEEQLALLSAHRRTLAHYLQQSAILSDAHTPPGVAHGIDEARRSIRRIKSVLGEWGAVVEDHPNDEPDNESDFERRKAPGHRPRLKVLLPVSILFLSLSTTLALLIFFNQRYAAQRLSIENVVIGEADDHYKIQVTMLNPSESDILAKSIDVTYVSKENIECMPRGGNFEISDHIVVSALDGDKLRIKPNVSTTEQELANYSIMAQGYLTNFCFDTELNISFPASFIVQGSGYTQFYISLPKEFKVTKVKELFGSTQAPQFVAVSLEKPKNSYLYKSNNLSLKVSLDSSRVVSYTVDLLQK